MSHERPFGRPTTTPPTKQEKRNEYKNKHEHPLHSPSHKHKNTDKTTYSNEISQKSIASEGKGELRYLDNAMSFMREKLERLTTTSCGSGDRPGINTLRSCRVIHSIVGSRGR